MKPDGYLHAAGMMRGVRSRPWMDESANLRLPARMRKVLPRIAFAAATLAAVAMVPLKSAAQGLPPANPYIQSAPYRAPGYGQPGYAQPPNYPSPGFGQASPYGHQAYPQQPYTPQAPQQPYGQQAYAPPEDNYPQDGYGQQPQDYGQPQYGNQPQAQPLDAEQLEQLVAPIALYPDMLVAQILAAATYPAQVAAADQWRRSIGNAPPDQIVGGANAQGWDPSVKALTAFPQVLAMLDQNLQWTTDLGNAYYNQPQDVLQTIQVMRQRGQAAGTLQNSSWETVSNDQGYLEVAPANPAVVYVPAYDPWTSYGQQVQPYSGFSLSGVFGAIGSFVGNGLMRFGPGIAMGAFRATPWGALAWGLDWLANNVLFNHSTYSSQSTTVAHWNLPGRTPRGYPQQAFGRQGEQYNRMPRGNNWAGGYSGQRPEPIVRQPERFAGNRPIESPRSGYGNPGYGAMDRNAVRPALGGYRPNEMPANRPQPYAARPQDAYNHQPEPIHQNYGSGFMSRPGDAYGNRSGGFTSPAPGYRAPSAPQRGNFGGGYAQPPANRAFGGQQFKPEKSGGFHMFGGGQKSDFKAPKMPKSFGHEKMPKAPHMSEHGHSGGGHSFGGHHR